MSMHLVTGYAGIEHITAADQGAFNAAFFGTGQYVMESGNMCEASITSNNNVRILDGEILMKGRHIRIEPNTYEDVNITTGTAGMNRNDLIVIEYQEDTGTGIENIGLKVIKGTESSGTATDPAYIDGDILGGATHNQMPLYRVVLKGVVLSAIEPLFDTISNYQALAEKYEKEFIAYCQNHLNSLGVLDTMEEVEANTQENQLAGALAVRELSATVEEYDNALADTVPYNLVDKSIGEGKVRSTGEYADGSITLTSTQVGYVYFYRRYKYEAGKSYTFSAHCETDDSQKSAIRAQYVTINESGGETYQSLGGSPLSDNPTLTITPTREDAACIQVNFALANTNAPIGTTITFTEMQVLEGKKKREYRPPFNSTYELSQQLGGLTLYAMGESEFDPTTEDTENGLYILYDDSGV